MTKSKPAHKAKSASITKTARKDLVTRKVPLNGGATVKAYLDELRESVARVRTANDPAFGMTAKRLDEAIASLDRATPTIVVKQTGNHFSEDASDKADVAAMGQASRRVQ